MVKKISDYASRQPHFIFLIDGIGALFSTLLLAGLVALNEPVFGMSQHVALLLAVPAGLFALYSLSCYFLKPKKYPAFLRAIIVANLLYCLVSAGALFYYRQQTTLLGVAYFSGEIILVLLLVYVEWQVFKVSRSVVINQPVQ